MKTTFELGSYELQTIAARFEILNPSSNYKAEKSCLMDLLSDIEKQLQKSHRSSISCCLEWWFRFHCTSFFICKTSSKNDRTYRLYQYEQSTFITD